MYIRNALSNIRRSPFQAFAAIFVFAVTFFVATVISILIYSSAQVLNYFETRPRVLVYIKNEATPTEIEALGDKIKSDNQITDVNFVSKEDALSIYKNATSGNPLLGQFVSPSTLPPSWEFSVKDINNMQKVIDSLKTEKAVDSIDSTVSLGDQATMKTVIDRLTRITYYIRLGGLVFVSVLGFTSFLVLMVIVSMRIANKKSEFDTLSLMGATSSFIKTPVMLEAIIYVTLGVVFGWILGLVALLYSAPTITNAFGAISVLPKGSGLIHLGFSILGIEILIGFVIAIIGGWVSLLRATSK